MILLQQASAWISILQWSDEIARAIYGFLACWPFLTFCRHKSFKPFTTSLATTFYMIPAWWFYSALEKLICG